MLLKSLARINGETKMEALNTKTETARWDVSYEWKTVILLAIGFGLVGLDRMIMFPLFPFIQKDLGLNYSQIGMLAGVLSIAWGITAPVIGRISDKVGHRIILIPSVILFSIIAAITGFAGSVASLVVMRLMMGVVEGAYLPVSQACITEASKPNRLGMNQGFQLASFVLVGMGLTPIIATQLLNVVPSWRYVFMIVCLPGLLLAIPLYFIIRDPAHVAKGASGQVVEHMKWHHILGTRNVLLGGGGVLASMCCVFVIAAMMPNYLMDYLKLPPQTMGFVMSAVGFAGFVGEFLIMAASDYLGRKPVAIGGFLLALIPMYLLMHTGPSPVLLFILLGTLGFFCMGLMGLFTGPIPTDAIGITGAAAAVGFATGAGEIFGGGIAPAIGGWIAQNFGIQHILDFAMVGLVIGVIFSLFLKESAPRLVAKAGRNA
jgi:MFS family permease